MSAAVEEVTQKPTSRFAVLMDMFDSGGSMVSLTSKELSSQEKLITAINQFEAFKKELAFFSLIFSLIQLSILLYTLFYQSAFKREYKYNFIVKFAILAITLPLSILGLICSFGVIASAAPIISIISTAKGLLEKTWDLGVSIFQRFKGEGKAEAEDILNLKTDIKSQIVSEKVIHSPTLLDLTNKINSQQDRHAKIANASHGLIVCAVAAVGSILLLTPAMPVGAAILAGVTAYSFMHALGYNPFKLIARGINKIAGKAVINVEPFAHKTEMTVYNELQNEVKKEKSVAPQVVSESAKYKLGSSAILHPTLIEPAPVLPPRSEPIMIPQHNKNAHAVNLSASNSESSVLNCSLFSEPSTVQGEVIPTLHSIKPLHAA